MKKAYLILLVACFSIFINKSIFATGPLNPMPSVYFEHDYSLSPYDIPCQGGTVGMSPIISGGNPPYTYKWYNSSGVLISTAMALPPSTAGTYTIYLYSGSNNSSWNVTLTEPSAMSITFTKSSFAGGYNVSYYEGMMVLSIALCKAEYHRILINGQMVLLMKLMVIYLQEHIW